MKKHQRKSLKSWKRWVQRRTGVSLQVTFPFHELISFFCREPRASKDAMDGIFKTEKRGQRKITLEEAIFSPV
jgi:hypothetical protein